MKSFAQYLTETPKNLTLADFSPILGLTDPMQMKVMDRVVMNFVNLANDAIRSGSVLKSGYASLSRAANQVADEAFSQLSWKYLNGGKYQQLPQALQFHEFKPSHIGLVSNNLAKAEKLPVNHQYKTDAITVLKNLQQAETLVGYFKQHIGTKETKAEREAKAAYEAPRSTKDARLLVSNVLTLMTNEVKAQYVKQLEEPWIQEVEAFFTKEHHDQLRHLKTHPEQDAERKQRNAASRTKHQEQYGNTWGFREEGRNPTFLEIVLLPIVATTSRIGGPSYTYSADPMHGKPVYTPKPNWKQLLHEKAVNEAEAMQAEFVAKNVAKLSSIVEVKGNIDGNPKVLNVYCRAGIIEGNIKFSFTDGSYFTVRNKIVSKFYLARNGQYATMHQFPTTFHDAKLPNGAFMKGQPSEEEMNEIFAVA